MNSRIPPKKFLIGIAVAVLVPLFCFLVVSYLSKGKSAMPGYFGFERLDSQNVNGKWVVDSVFHRVSDLRLTNQLGKVVSLDSDLKGKILVVDFFFTTCPSVCPRLTDHMSRLVQSFKKDPKKEASLDTVVQFLSLTVNPERDSFPVLRVYADRYHANHDRWWFLTGSKKDIYSFARQQLKLTVGPGDGGADDFVHTEQFVLIDKDRNIRGYYNGLEDSNIVKCADDIVYLTLERKTHQPRH